MNEHRRADDTGGVSSRPVARVLTLRQFSTVLALVLTLVTLLQTVGLKFVADSYIDQRIKIHNGDSKAHEGTIAQAVQDGDRLHRQFEELRREISDATKAMNDTNQRLARIEGALQARPVGR
jgi:septal ring factor EnvC (AmiA/AmiB activator)